jgi:HAD superfamily hydrolase (TIGR01459 family)
MRIMSHGAIPLLPNIRVLKERYPIWLCDVWGVVHNGVHAFNEPIDALIQFRHSGGRVALITNAPRPAAPVQQQLKQLGVSDEAYDVVVTSGDATRSLLKQYEGQLICHIGPDRDRSLFADLKFDEVEPARAKIALCTGLENDVCESVADYEEMFQDLAARQVVLICANPDLVVDRGGILVPCAGALAEAYAKMGGNVFYAGKPHRPIYELALNRLALGMPKLPSRGQVLAIGDGLKTDIEGAAKFGVDSMFIASGIHWSDVSTRGQNIDFERILSLVAASSRPPIGVQKSLCW